ncbi:hypothetical protein H072_5464 [Dactylellina haptotyla CBS 200.50]|uniref:FAD-binding FR-type domain-containing protein n=1 Tax=Dactylellina haptotyla (strain CBS 200.50) TaxID=1284197 RepID=S8ACE4_DACHA|nr:hypothetical protein H072_5464 [Dactylellina haptotyla CBS 200.50]
MLQRSILRCNSHLPSSGCRVLGKSGLLPERQSMLRSRLLSSTAGPAPSSRGFYTKTFFAIPTAFILGYITYKYTTSSTSFPINPHTFTHYTVTSTTPLSPSSSLISLSPKRHTKPPPSFWSIINSEGIWSIQIKQPQLQIQREYTPLPHSLSSNPEDESPADQNRLDIFVRAVNGGELSHYLLSRKPGDLIEVRGPLISYIWTPADSAPEEQDIRNVVFIAGGTGISPAIQVARHLISQQQKDGKERRLSVLFASRSSKEQILPQLKELEAVASGVIKIDVKYFYDDKSTFIKRSDIEDVIGGLLPADKVTTKPGRDVIMVSGPEGFVTHYAGKKGWKEGMETQGVLGGIVGEILKNRKQGGKIEVMKL